MYYFGKISQVLMFAAFNLITMKATGENTTLLHHMGYDDIEDYRDHPCRRTCTQDTEPMVCEYNFLIERYHTLTRACWNCPHNPTDCSRPHCVAADGGDRGVLTANRMLPGPGIHVCEGDTIRVRVHNKMENSESTTIHWHGIHQMGSPFMDGVAMVTQCSILAHTAFTYVFLAATPGTHYWHAHSGLQRADGLFGHLVIRRRPDKEPHAERYDFDLPEHTMVIHDWLEHGVAAQFADHHHSDGSNKADSILINGKGNFHLVKDSESGQESRTPREVFEVTQGSRYRFRVISNGILNCPLTVSVDNHTLEVIASDGEDVELFEVEYFNIFAGERFDFVLTTNQTVDNYLLRVHGELDCGPLFTNAQQTAILHYDGAPNDPDYYTPPSPLSGKGLNTVNSKDTENLVSINGLRSYPGDIDSDPSVDPSRVPDLKVTLAMDLRVVNNDRFHNEDFYSVDDFPVGNKNIQSPQINNITNLFPPSPALTQLADIPQDMFCNKDTRDCSKEMCECIHFYRVNLGDVVEMTLVDEGYIWDTANHPTHLHGHGFRIMAMDKLGKYTSAEEIEKLDEAGEIKRNYDHPPKKDTVTVPDGGYTVLRFHANNPGMWLLHCHVEYHIEIGMAVLFQVGDVEEFPKTPQGFPTCGDWSPTYQ